MSPGMENTVRVGSYAAVLTCMALWKWLTPRPQLGVGRRPRWPNNLGILAVDIVVVRLLVPTTAVGVAVIVSDRGWDLFPMLGLPHWLALAAGVIALVFVIYLQHRIFHYVPALWRVHRTST